MPPGKDLRAIAFSLQELIKEYTQFLEGQHIHFLNAFAWHVFNQKSSVEMGLGNRSGGK